jgi:hypothetical protein
VSLCQMAAVRAGMRCSTRAIIAAGVRLPCCSSSGWSLEVSLTDSVIWRSGLRPARRGLRRFLQQVISSRVRCGSQGARVSRHGLMLGARASCPRVPPGTGHLGDLIGRRGAGYPRPRRCRAAASPAGRRTIATSPPPAPS